MTALTDCKTTGTKVKTDITLLIHGYSERSIMPIPCTADLRFLRLGATGGTAKAFFC